MHLNIQFDWDDGNRNKCCKHGLTVLEIEHLFRSDPLIAPDHKHSDVEQCFIAVGRTSSGRPAFVAFCWRGDEIRPVSARCMHKREVLNYETQARPENDKR
ncbi:MAG: BrnT family toxin [Alphaproteobacteria bacterium]|nr:BrnT family toxin [Alphaproteobacteria bacterium]